MYKKVKKFGHKILKKVKEKDLQSFLLDLDITNEVKVYLGPIFFGCKEYHPPIYSLNFGDSHKFIYTPTHKEKTLKGVFRKIPVMEIQKEEKKSFHPVAKRRKIITDLYPHKCPGHKKVFKPVIASQIVDLGATQSIIEGETSQEIPLYCLKKFSSRALEAKLELVTPSDIWEKKRSLLPYKERIAHTHFPKEFVTVRVIGPNIPGALTITKIRSKREYKVKMDVLAQLETKKIIKEKTKKEVANVVIEPESPAKILQSRHDIKEEVKSPEGSVFEEYEQSEQRLSEMEEVMSVEGEDEEEDEEDEEDGSVILSEVQVEPDEENLENEELEIEN